MSLNNLEYLIENLNLYEIEELPIDSMEQNSIFHQFRLTSNEMNHRLTVCVRLLPNGVTEILAAGIPPRTNSPIQIECKGDDYLKQHYSYFHYFSD